MAKNEQNMPSTFMCGFNATGIPLLPFLTTLKYFSFYIYIIDASIWW